VALQKNLTFALLGEDKTASSSMTHAQETAEKVTGRIGGVFSKLGGQIGGEFGEVLNRVGDGIASVGEHGAKLSSVLGVGGGVITGLGVALQTMGSSDKQASDQLQQSIKASGHSFGDFRDDIEKTISKQEDFGHSAVDTQTALRKMTQATNDPKKALEQMGVVANLAAAKHISLADAADLVDRVVAGKGGKTLAQYGITMKTTGDKTKNAQDALDQLSSKVSGQASSSMDNFGAKVNAIKTHMTDWAANMGEKVGPALTIIGPALMGVSAAMEIGKAVSTAFKSAQLAQTVATEAGTVAQNGFNLSLLANPITLVILAIVALVAGLVWFFTQTKLGQQIWHNFTQFIGTAINWLWNSVIKPVFGFIGTIFTWLYKNIILPYIGLIVLEFKVLGAIFSWLWNAIVMPVANWIAGAVRNIGSTIGSVFGAIGGIIRGAFNGVVSFVKGIFNGVIDAVNGIIGGINAATGIGASIGIHIGKIPKLPHLALGGIVTKPTVALIGESGPEEIRPLKGTGSRGGGGTTIQVDVHVPNGFVGNARELSTLLINGIRAGLVNAPELNHALGN
jgi:hypothetical protein